MAGTSGFFSCPKGVIPQSGIEITKTADLPEAEKLTTILNNSANSFLQVSFIFNCSLMYCSLQKPAQFVLPAGRLIQDLFLHFHLK